MRLKQRPRRPAPESTVPLINIVFLMLIFFLFAGTITRDDAGRIEPPSSIADDERIRSTDALIVDAQGGFFHRNAQVTLEELVAGRDAKDAEAGDASRPFLLAPDAGLPAAKLKETLGALKGAGIDKITLITLRKGQ